MTLPFAPMIGAALATQHHFLWVYRPACRTMRDIDLRTLDHPAQRCRPHAPFCRSLLRLSKASIADGE